MTTFHTPGPWDYWPSQGEDNPRVMAKQVTTFGNFYVALCNVDADARLIAAAPALLAALEAVMRDCDLKVIGHGGRMDKAIDQARAAIKQAKGE